MSWKNQPISEKQIHTLRETFEYTGELPKTKGEASLLIQQIYQANAEVWAHSFAGNYNNDYDYENEWELDQYFEIDGW